MFDADFVVVVIVPFCDIVVEAAGDRGLSIFTLVGLALLLSTGDGGGLFSSTGTVGVDCDMCDDGRVPSRLH